MENRNENLEQRVEKIQAEQSENIMAAKKKRNSLFKRIAAVIIAGAIAITGIIHIVKRSKNNSKDNKPTQSTIVPTIVPEDKINLDNLGLKYGSPTLPTEKPQYGQVTGNVNKEEIVEKDNVIWKDETAANNSVNVGKVEIDDKKGTLEVKPNGDIFVKEEGFEIKKENGTIAVGNVTKETKPTTNVNNQNSTIGTNGSVLPPGYVHDENLNKDVVEEDANKFVYADANYYDSTGQLIYSKGELISKEDLELAKKFLTTTKATIAPTTKPTVASTTKATVAPTTKATVAPTTKATVAPTTKATVAPTTKATVAPTAKPKETEGTFIPAQGTVNADGTYTIDGLTFESKADYEQWIIQGYEGYGVDLDGIMKPETEIKTNYNQKTK